MAIQDAIESLRSFDLNDLNDVNNIGSLPVAVKSIIWMLAFVAGLAIGYFIFVTPLQEELTKTQKQEVSLRVDFEKKYFESAHLEGYRQQKKEMELSFETILRQLPSDTEIPGLIEDITLVGLKNGLNFTSINLQAEKKFEFYIEKPIQIVVSGSYHELGSFVSDVADLSRIVTLHDFTILPEGAGARGAENIGGILRMNILAKTYRYNDERR
ncbi:MAG: type 4a pilus biogenesis protein PilO [SAR86 cluster bacterium]|jgi:type IV pilus assembly protein PilO|uniref:Type 4a pilus biogenesis protein PilO n=1 Tax=SAR86 cluster bacterium TaxID=2030880 RepID=A0A973A972_9GAMM|nr:type 4a pilus biogenesis protein PilO [SAR86 cluster bacterium]|tara:strand:+ start:5777 stop:6415 length:639 start_codon:yes stop_codon:yes gene_type:complete